MIESHVWLGLEAALTEGQRQVITETVYRRNPHMRGAHVADILDILQAMDAHLDVTEDERYRKLFATATDRFETLAVTGAILALLYAFNGDAPHPDDVEDLAARAMVEARSKAEPESA